MSRRLILFSCAGETLVGTLDEAPGSVGLLLVSGGNEVRSGPFAMQARLAAEIAGHGFSVLRFDRRGVGDSTGANRGFAESGADLSAALAALRAHCPALERIVGFGNCDAASALMLHGGAGCSALVLSNPWTMAGARQEALPPAAIRRRYADRLRNPREIARLLKGEVNLAKLARGLRAMLARTPPPGGLVEDMRQGLAGFSGPVRLLLAGRDRTAQAFLAAWGNEDPRLLLRAGADHAFSGPLDRSWLLEQILACLRQQAGPMPGQATARD